MLLRIITRDGSLFSDPLLKVNCVPRIAPSFPRRQLCRVNTTNCPSEPLSQCDDPVLRDYRWLSAAAAAEVAAVTGGRRPVICCVQDSVAVASTCQLPRATPVALQLRAAITVAVVARSLFVVEFRSPIKTEELSP